MTERGCVDDDELQAYVEDAMPPAARAAFDAHIADCVTCRGLVAATVRALYGDDASPATAADGDGDGDGGPAIELPTVPYATYTVDREIARGGLGRVLRARDERLGRTVALKVLLPNNVHAEARFVHEAHLTARLEHPAIVPVHEAGRWPNGEPFYAMKLVSGQTLTEKIRAAGSLAERLALLPSVLAVAEALAYAHAHGVIHRDLKPANVLVGQFGETVVIDWGLAKELGGGVGTLDGMVMGTPPYMPPEQARGQPVDAAADVYALGAILYEVLCGRAPYTGVAGDVLAAVKRGPPRPLEELADGVPRDLLAIVRKAMARELRERYPTAKELAADLAHFQTGQLVSAREYSAWSLVARWLRRHRLPVAVATAALAVVLTLGALSLSRTVRARAVAERARADEEQARRQAEDRQHELVLLQARAVVDRDPTRALAWLRELPVTAPGWPEVREVAVEAVSRGYARHVWRLTRKHTSLGFSPDGRALVSAGAGEARVADPVTGAHRPLALGDHGLFEVAFASDGTLAATADDGTLAIAAPGALAGGGPPPRLLRAGGAPGVRTYVAIAPDGRTVATATDQRGELTLWDVAAGTARPLPGPRDGARDVAFSPDGRTVAVATVDRAIRLYDVATGATRSLAGTDVTSRLQFTADGTALLAAELSGIRSWDLATGDSRLLPFPSRRYIAVAASADGRTIAAAGFEGPVHLLDVARGEVTTLAGHESLVVDLTFSPDGQLLGSIAMDQTMRVWVVPPRRDRVLAQLPPPAIYPACSPDGRTVATGDGQGRVWLLPVAGDTARALTGHTGAVQDVAIAPDGRTVASRGADRTVRLWDVATGAGREVATTAAWVDFGRLRFSPDGALLAASLDLDTLAVLDVATGRRVCTFAGAGFNLAHAFAPDSKSIAFTADHEVRLATLPGCASRTLYAHDPGKSAYQLAFSPDGRTLASASDDATVGVVDLASGQSRRLRGQDADVIAVAFVDDHTLASGAGDRLLRLWELATGEARVLRGHDTLVAQLAVSPDGRTLASLGLDATLHVWDVATGAGANLRGHRDRLRGACFAPDGSWLASASLDGTVRLWPADPLQGVPLAPAEVAAWLGRLTTARIDADDRATSR